MFNILINMEKNKEGIILLEVDNLDEVLKSIDIDKKTVNNSRNRKTYK